MGLLNSGSTLASIVDTIVGVINMLVVVMAPLALCVFFWGLAMYIYKSDDSHAREEGRSAILWSLIALFVMFSLWGLVALLNVAFFGGETVGSYTYTTDSSGLPAIH